MLKNSSIPTLKPLLRRHHAHNRKYFL